MANILYGVAGEGSGHAARAIEVIRHLIGRGHKVVVLSHDRGFSYLEGSCDVRTIFGLQLAYKEQKIQYRKTLLKNITKIPEAVQNLRNVSRLIDEERIDVAFTDFEPTTCLTARQKYVPVISIDNQHALTNGIVEIPSGHRLDYEAAKQVVRFMTPRADAYLILSFFPVAVRWRRTYVFPPVVQEDARAMAPTDEGHILVYVTSASGDMLDALEHISMPVICYGAGREGILGNITFKKPSRGEFLADLASAHAVVATAGLSLISEALYLGKPYYAIPVAKQFEQILNAYHIEKSGFGGSGDGRDPRSIEAFLKNLDAYRAGLAAYPRGGNEPILKKVDAFVEAYT